MINLKHELKAGLPVIELTKTNVRTKSLPTVFFYHGWESYKERVLEHGYSLAQAGFRVVLPEAYNHGERRTSQRLVHNPMNFWEVVTKSVQEFPLIAETYVKENKTRANQIGVAGLSMGGITTSAILTQYKWVKTASILMGSPSPIQFTKWLLQNYKVDGKPIYDSLDSELVATRLNELTPMSLNLQAEKIAGRPIYFWHGEKDIVVPAKITQDFVEKHQGTKYGEHITFELTEGVGHKVPKDITAKTTEYFKKNL